MKRLTAAELDSLALRLDDIESEAEKLCAELRAQVQEFGFSLVYRRGRPKKPSVVIASWAGYKKTGPLLISTEHRGTADGKSHRCTSLFRTWRLT